MTAVAVGVIEHRAQPRQQRALDETLEAFGKFLPGCFIVCGLGQYRVVRLLKGIEHCPTPLCWPAGTLLAETGGEEQDRARPAIRLADSVSQSAASRA